MSNYTAVAAGSNRVKVFDIKSGVTSYTINLESKAEITNVQCPGNSIAVTFKDGCGRIKTNVYNDIKRGVLSYSNIVGNYDVSKPAVKQQTAPQPATYIPPVEVRKPAFDRDVMQDEKVYATDYTDDSNLTPHEYATIKFQEFQHELEMEQLAASLKQPLHMRLLNLYCSLGRGCCYILLVVMCYIQGKHNPYTGHTFFDFIIWSSIIAGTSWLFTRLLYKLLVYIGCPEFILASATVLTTYIYFFTNK